MLIDEAEQMLARACFALTLRETTWVGPGPGGQPLPAPAVRRVVAVRIRGPRQVELVVAGFAQAQADAVSGGSG